MNALPRSGRCFANLFARITISSLIEVVGENGMHAVFRMAHLPELIDALPPPNENKEFDSADFAAIFQNLDEIFGTQGGRALAIRGGRMTFNEGLKQHGASFVAADQALPVSLVAERVQHGLEAVSILFDQLTDQHIVLTQPGSGRWCFSVSQCGVCEGRQSMQPVCAFTEGLLEEALFYFSGGSKFNVTETSCIAQGDESCQFSIEIPPPENPPFTL